MRYRAGLIGLTIFIVGFVAGQRFANDPDSRAAQPAPESGVSAKIPPTTRSGTLPGPDPGLELRLLHANAQISRLESRNRALSRQIEQMDLPLPAETTYPELMQRLERLPPGLIRQQLALIFDESYADTVADPHALARELIEIALDEETEAESELQVGIDFSLSPVRGLRGFVDLERIEAGKRVFAHFTANREYGNLITRWQHRETGEILLFETLQLTGNPDDQISLRPRNGWSPGSYLVSTYDLDDGRRLVGAASYRIDSVVEDETTSDDRGVDRSVIEDLLSAGQAVPKSF